MLHDTPLRENHEEYVRRASESVEPRVGAQDRPGAALGAPPEYRVTYLPYGPEDASHQHQCEIVASFGFVELEYAAIRRGAAIFDLSHRGTLLVTGKDRRDFLNSMVTQDLRNLAPGTCAQTFWLNRKGRVDADLILVELGEQMLVDVDIHQAADTVKSLGDFVFSEEVDICNVSDTYHRIGIHGPSSTQVLSAATGESELSIEPGQSQALSIAGCDVVIYRRDLTGEIGFEIFVAYDSTKEVWSALMSPMESSSKSHEYVKPGGWHAFNIARIEAGTPLVNIDFATTNLPHEAGLLDKRVSFSKGCYLGQEIVARLHNLGKPKQQLVGLRIEGEELPVAGAPVHAREKDDSCGESVGVVTSSTLSPMLGSRPIAFAMIKKDWIETETPVLVACEEGHVPATVCPLQFWPAPN